MNEFFVIKTLIRKILLQSHMHAEKPAVNKSCHNFNWNDQVSCIWCERVSERSAYERKLYKHAFVNVSIHNLSQHKISSFNTLYLFFLFKTLFSKSHRRRFCYLAPRYEMNAYVCNTRRRNYYSIYAINWFCNVATCVLINWIAFFDAICQL